MGDVGEYWREHREQQQARRRYWHECPTCRHRYGTGTKVAPGHRCRNCGWRVPGQAGSDIARAATDIAVAQNLEAERVAKRVARRQARRCRFCNRMLRTPEGRAQHEATVHAERLRRGVS